MRYLILFLTFILAGCFEDSVNPVTSEQKVDTTKIDTTKIVPVDSIKISGRVNLSNAGGIDVGSIKISVAGITTNPNVDGSYNITGIVPKSTGLGRVSIDSVSDTILDTVKIVVAGDTMVEMPIISWKDVLPTNYLVQRNVGCVIPNKYIGNIVQAVYWDNDSIARVLNLGKTTSKNKFSGFIYTAYNDSQFVNQLPIYNLFVRIKKSDSVVAHTEISEVTAQVGNLDYDSTQFENVKSFIKYLFTVIPNDSSVKNYMDTVKKELIIDTTFDTTKYSFVDTNYVTIPYFFKDTTFYSTEDSSYNKYAISSILNVKLAGSYLDELTIDCKSNKNTNIFKNGKIFSDTTIALKPVTIVCSDILINSFGTHFTFDLETIIMSVRKYYR